MQVKLHLNKLILKTKFTINHGSYDYREQLIVELHEKDIKGFGETIAIDYYGLKLSTLIHEAERIIPSINKLDASCSHFEFYKFLLLWLPENPFLRCAFDQAFIDYKSKMSGKSVRRYLGIKETSEVASSITIGLSDTLESVTEKLEENWPFFKIKVNKTNQREDVIKLVRSQKKDFGIDANGAFNLEESKNMLSIVEKNNGQYVEQLLDKKLADQVINLNQNTKILQFADESICSLKDAEKLSNFYDGFVLKLTKCGGITPAMEIIEYCKTKDIKLLAGCMTESSIGINHMLHLLPLFEYADLDGAYLISNDQEVTKIDSSPKRILKDDGFFY